MADPILQSLGSFDIRFDVSQFDVAATLTVRTNILNENDPTYSYIWFVRSANYIEIFSDYESFKYTVSSCRSIHVFWHNEFCTIYINEVWAYTFSFVKVTHPETPSVWLYCSGGTVNLTNIRRQELCDWREAIWIDMESSAQNAISSVIQQRPVEIINKYDGSIRFQYSPQTRDDVDIKFIHSYSGGAEDSSSVASDAIVYFYDMAVLADEQAAADVGFVTRMYRLPDLESGAIKAARVMQQRARENLHRHAVQCRFNLALELGDIANIVYIRAGSLTEIEEYCIVEAIRFSIRDGQATMDFEGRNYGA